MENLFKKGLASLALASVMTSSIFGGNASYVDVRINYLSGTDKAVLGYNSWDTDTKAYKSGAKKDLVELYIRVLDRDGNLADKASDGSTLVPMTIKTGGLDVNYLINDDNNATTLFTVGNTDNKPINIVSRAVTVGTTTDADIELISTVTGPVAIQNKNAARYTLDYTDKTVAKFVDTIVVKAGKIEKAVNIQLVASNAKGLIVRVTRKSNIDATFGAKDMYINDLFENIKLSGDTGNLSAQSNDVPQIIAGASVPIRVYASTVLDTNITSGKFTTAPNLDDKKIIVVAVGDYYGNTTNPAINGLTDVYLGHQELTMTDGLATGDITINYGLPEGNTTTLTGHSSFDFDKDDRKFGGLGVAFIAYVLDTPSISNNGLITLSNGVLKTTTSNLEINGSSITTDAIKVKSGAVTGFAGGLFDTTPNNKIAFNLWAGNKTDLFVSNSNGITSVNSTTASSNATIVITAIDKLGNPASITNPVGAADGNFTIAINGVSQFTDGNLTRMNTDFNFIITQMATNFSVNGLAITSGNVTIVDGSNEISRSRTVSVSYNKGPLAGTSPFKFQAHTADLVGSTPKDVVGSLSRLINSITVANGSDTTTIFTEQKKEKEYANMKVSIKVADFNETSKAVTLHMKVLKVVDGKFNSAIAFFDENTSRGASDTKLGIYKVDINNTGLKVGISTGVTPNITSTATSTGNIATITFNEINGSNYKTLVGTDTTVILKGSQKNTKGVNIHRVNIDSYVATTTSIIGAESFVGKDSEPGTVGKTQIDFDFSGSLTEQFAGKVVATIVFSGEEATTAAKGNNASIKVGVLGELFVSTNTIEAYANTNVIKTIIPSDTKKLSIVLYGGFDAGSDTNKKASKTRYKVSSIKLNNDFVPVYTSREKNTLTTATDIDLNQDKWVTVRAGEALTAAKVKISGIGTSIKKTGSGKDADNLAKLPESKDNALLKRKDGVKFSATPGPVFTDDTKAISTNTYYSLFDNDNNLKIVDVYGNEVQMGSTKIADNYTLTVSDSKCAKVEMAGGGKSSDPAYIYFEECAAGQTIDLIISVNGNDKAKNTITFTNIVKVTENKKFNITLDVGSENYNVANNDVIVKIQGDGRTSRADTIITITSDNKDATVKLVPVSLLEGREFGSMIGKGTTYGDNIKNSGSYYVVTADKDGTITIKADATIPISESASGKDVALTGTLSFKMRALDLNKPTASLVSTASGITVTVSDANLDTKNTKVEIHNKKDGKVTDAKMGASGVYTSKLSQGSYSVQIFAIDLAGNSADITLVATIGVSSLTEEEIAVKTLIAKGKYTIAGTFSSYDFKDVDDSKDWIYTDKDGMVYQLLGNEPTDTDAFGWKEVTDETIKATGENEWYMVQTGTGKFDWALANKDGLAYQLSGVKADGTFKFSGRLTLNVKHTDGTLTFTAK